MSEDSYVEIELDLNEFSKETLVFLIEEHNKTGENINEILVRTLDSAIEDWKKGVSNEFVKSRNSTDT